MIAIGLCIMVVTQASTLAGLEPFATWNTPIAWTGFILFADGVVYRARGDSWIRSAPGEFAFLVAVSIPLWIIFEGYNLRLNNWYYSGLVESFWLRQVGFAWAFATIWPAIFEAAELAAVLRAGPNSRAATPSWLHSHPPFEALTLTAAVLMLASPFLVADHVARYLAAPVWLGFIVLLDPINRRLGAEVLTRDRAINLGLGGLLCGVLWEFWNYWSHAKWHYTVPIMENVKIFEMPLPGYLGFPPFALECFTMYVFVRHAFTGRGRPIAVLVPPDRLSSAGGGAPPPPPAMALRRDPMEQPS